MNDKKTRFIRKAAKLAASNLPISKNKERIERKLYKLGKKNHKKIDRTASLEAASGMMIHELSRQVV